ncbi:MAG: ComF family protein [Thermoanaerobacteraceae bacterium]
MIFLDLLFPPKTTCIICGENIKSGYLCENCEHKLEFIHGNICNICGKPIENKGICSDCNSYGHIFKKNRSVFEYKGVIKDLIARFKYFKERDLADFFAQYIKEVIEEENWPIDLIIPVPLHKAKLDERGYNQSELLAREISYKLDILMSKALRRIRNTPTQTDLHREERIKNVKGAFNVTYKNAVENKKILLIDDVITTGATLDECARVLKEYGAEDIYVATIARGKN